MSKTTDWTYLLLVGFLAWCFMARLDRLGKQLHYGSYRIRREMAELLGNEENRRELIGFIILVVWHLFGSPPPNTSAAANRLFRASLSAQPM
jgi:hypothetical protein